MLQNMHIHDDDAGSDLNEYLDDLYPIILLSNEEKQCTRAPQCSALIAKAFGKSLGFKYLNHKIHAIWKPQGDLQCIDLGLDYFLIRFKLKEDYWKVINDGPWFIGQQFLSIRQWSSGFSPMKEKSLLRQSALDYLSSQQHSMIAPSSVEQETNLATSYRLTPVPSTTFEFDMPGSASKQIQTLLSLQRCTLAPSFSTSNMRESLQFVLSADVLATKLPLAPQYYDRLHRPLLPTHNPPRIPTTTPLQSVTSPKNKEIGCWFKITKLINNTNRVALTILRLSLIGVCPLHISMLFTHAP